MKAWLKKVYKRYINDSLSAADMDTFDLGGHGRGERCAGKADTPAVLSLLISEIVPKKKRINPGAMKLEV